jgi:hypothetical protein
MPGNKGWQVVERLPPLSCLFNDRVSVLSVGSDCWALWAEEGSVEDLYAAIVEVPAQPYFATSAGSSLWSAMDGQRRMWSYLLSLVERTRF